MVERQPSKLNVDGSSPFTRFLQAGWCITHPPACFFRRSAVWLYLRTQVPVVVSGMISFVIVCSKTWQTHPASGA